MDTEVRVSEAMTKKIITLAPTATADEAAKLMALKGIGSIVVMGKKPEGIVTERDICYKIVAKDKRPGKVKLKDIMSKPLKTIGPNATLTEASRMMAKHNLRRLPVMENKALVGIVTERDIIAIAPETIEILQELSRINSQARERAKEVPEKGTCEICGDYMVNIKDVDGAYLCESCREDSTGGE